VVDLGVMFGTVNNTGILSSVFYLFLTLIDPCTDCSRKIR
jgi:hypothetical protein